MRRGWIFLLLAAGAGAQEFSEAKLDETIPLIARGELLAVERITSWGPRAARAAPALVAAWGQDEQRVRQTPGLPEAVDAAVWTIGPAAIPDLARAVKGKERSERAARLLRRFAYHAPSAPLGADHEKRFFALLNDSEVLVRLAAARSLATRGPTVAPGLIALLGDKSPRRREAAAHGLACVEPPPEEAASALIAATSDTHAPAREQAVIALARLGASPERTYPILLAALESPDERVVDAALGGLEARGERIVPDLMGAWSQSDRIARGAAEVLARLGDAARQRVEDALRSGTPRQKRFAAFCLGEMIGGDIRGVEPALVGALGDPVADVRLAAADALGIAPARMSGPALDALVHATGDRDPRVRAAALAAAARASPADARVRDAATRSLVDADPGVRVAAMVVEGGGAQPLALGQAVESVSLPAVVRILAAERLAELSAGFAPALPSLTRVVRDAAQPSDVRAWAVFAVKVLIPQRMFEGRSGGRIPAEVRDAADRGLRWLAGAQEKDGRWAAEAWNRHDLGVTGLAILAFLAAGHTDARAGPHGENVRAGLDFVVSAQTESGLLVFGPRKQHTLVEHAIATQALCEAVAMTRDGKRRGAAQAAVAFCAAARNPALAWRYEPRGGENDTHVTTWMLTALRIADEAGFEVDPAAYRGASLWIDKMTDPNFGIVGYDYPGGFPFRAKGMNEDFPPDETRSMTAAGMWCRMILGEDPGESAMVRKGADVCLEIRPTFEKRGHVDFYYWHFGTLACFEAGEGAWAKWEGDLRRALLGRQKPDGSWDPEDAWGFAGGRVYSTAILTLALLTSGRYPRGWTRDPTLPEPYCEARAALQEAADSGTPRVRAAALPD